MRSSGRGREEEDSRQRGLYAQTQSLGEEGTNYKGASQMEVSSAELVTSSLGSKAALPR